MSFKFLHFSILALLLSPFSISMASTKLDCSEAYASKKTINNHNGKLKKIDIKGVVGADNIAIQCITQDEPIESAQSFDGKIIKNKKAKVRKERSDKGNGRVYHIDFLASSNDGSSCSGTVNVLVPINKGEKAIDDGRLFISTKNKKRCNLIPIDNTPTFLSEPIKNTQEGSVYLYQVETSNPAGYDISYSLKVAPSNMMIEANTGQLSWKPTFKDAGIHPIEIVILNQEKEPLISQKYDLAVTNTNQLPIALSKEYTLENASSINITLDGLDHDNDTISYFIRSEPSNGTLSGSDNIYRYTPNSNFSGTDTFTYFINDGEADSEDATITVSVTQNNQSPSLLIDKQVEAYQYNTYSNLSFTGEAYDPEDGDISHLIQWKSDLDGSLGFGAIVEAKLSIGQHQISASIEDTNGSVAIETLNIVVNTVPLEDQVIIRNFLASPNTIIQGTSTKIEWETLNADSVKLVSSTSTYSTRTSGSVSVSPNQTTDFILEVYKDNHLILSDTLSIVVISSEIDPPLEILQPITGIPHNNRYAQVLGVNTNQESLVFIDDKEACQVGDRFVFSNLELTSNAFKANLLSPNMDVFQKEIRFTNDPSNLSAIGVSPSQTCLKGSGLVRFELFGITQNYTSIEFDINNDGVVDGTVGKNEVFEYFFTSPGIYEITAEIFFTESNSIEVSVLLGVKENESDNSDQFYNAVWSNFLSTFDQQNSQSSINFFNPASQSKYSDILSIIKSDVVPLSKEVSNLEPLLTRDSYREYVFLRLEESIPKVYVISFKGGKILEL